MREASASTSNDHSITILLAEDNPANVMLIRDLLSHRGYRVLVAEDGLEAIEIASKAEPQLILMDVQMPNLDGLEATRRLKLHPRLNRIPVIILTALAMDGDRDRCLASGADDYLSKPVKMQLLYSRIDHWINGHQGQPLPDDQPQ
ncbi:response regulator [Motiliproteus coralliicola]|uniref:Response regulator n=1 Tax=Motiliproteus coralliicola TaxID=2283196 RepID=A0A369WI54_9GAMM|nr:response regulator [Motiliproteus coralliicola]RDE19135.1 response regulator [Motiliproteus coralliicola]